MVNASHPVRRRRRVRLRCRDRDLHPEAATPAARWRSASSPRTSTSFGATARSRAEAEDRPGARAAEQRARRAAVSCGASGARAVRAKRRERRYGRAFRECRRRDRRLRDRLPVRRRHRGRRVPRRPAGEAGPGRGAGRGRARPSSPRRSRTVTGSRLIRLQCYEGLDEAKALYEWNYKKQLPPPPGRPGARDRAGPPEADVFTEPFLLTRPLLAAIRSRASPVVLLINEVDRLDVETEALLLEVLSDYQVSIPELGTMVTGRRCGRGILTSNSARDLSEALKRRCLYLHIDYPARAREGHRPRPGPRNRRALAEQIAAWCDRSARSSSKRRRRSRKRSTGQRAPPLGKPQIDPEVIGETLHVLLKYQSDIAKARKELEVPEPEAAL